MAELHIARSPGVFPHARRKGFVAFCAVVSALIVALLLQPFSAAAGRRSGAPDTGSNRRMEVVTRGEQPAAEGGRDDAPAPVAGIPGRTFARLLGSGAPVYCGAGVEPLVALTFDDGPGVLTQQTLDLLRERGMTATFFLAGKLLGEGRFEGLPTRAARLGALGDHTWDHVLTVGMSSAELEEQIARTRRAIAAESGERVVLFRPPLGRHDDRVDAYVRSLGMLTVLWSVDSGDSQGARADRIVRAVRASLSPGDIVLLHENRGTTQNALPRILDLVESRGYTTVTVPELLAQDPPTNAQLRTGTCPA